MDLVTDTTQWYEKWYYPLVYLEFANDVCPLEKEEDGIHTPGGPR